LAEKKKSKSNNNQTITQTRNVDKIPNVMVAHCAVILPWKMTLTLKWHWQKSKC